MHMQLKQSGSVFLNHGLWYYSVQLPGEQKRRQVPLRAPGAKHTLKADRPRKMAEEAAARYWEEHTRPIRRHESLGITVAQLCAAWKTHCEEYYRRPDGSPTSAVCNAILSVRMFRDLYGHAMLAELTHADMLALRDALVRSGICRSSVNRRLWYTKHMIEWALDEAMIPAVVKAELTQVKGIKRGRTSAPERAPVRAIDDATIEKTVTAMMPNTADMVRVHRLTGMRPCELCAMRWSLIDTSQTPWIYRVPPEANKNSWRGELGMPRVVCIGPRARAILERHRGGDVPFSPVRSMAEHMAAHAAEAAHPLSEAAKARRRAAHVPRVLGERWNTQAYTRTIHAACGRAGIPVWGANRLRHAFGTQVRRQFGLDAAKAVLGHNDCGCVTDLYTFEAVEEETIRRATPAVEALG